MEGTVGTVGMYDKLMCVFISFVYACLLSSHQCETYTFLCLCLYISIYIYI